MKDKITRILLLIVMVFPTLLHAEVIINGTRVILHEKDKESVVQLKNKGKTPYLLQLWMDNGNPKSRPGEEKVPFIITPPVIRIDPGKGQAVRVLADNPNLPKDVESIFWFNMLEIPPKPKKTDIKNNNMLQMAFRTRIKLFYRPEGLTPTPLQAYKKLNISLKGNLLRIKNNSPYFITFTKLEVREDNNSPLLASVIDFHDRMINPNESIEYKLVEKTKNALTGKKIFYSIINDYGGESTNEQVLGNDI
ncbi:putative chaperone protein EcpD [Klebsiella pneumoniae]|nr:putative chaperone protein EcpD [Klebsiella pneumoniae]